MSVLARLDARVRPGRRRERRVVPVASCYHYRAQRFGGAGNHVYEDHVVGLVAGAPQAELRRAFAELVLGSQPGTMDEALAVDLGGWEAWDFPWVAGRPDPPVTEPAANPDIVCHRCEAGVLVSHVNRELRWLERAVDAMREGYQPERFEHIRCQELVGELGTTYLALDGNHRLAALHALGVTEVEVVVQGRPVVRADAGTWPDVRSGRRPRSSALAVFDAYGRASNPPMTRRHPAPLIEDEAPLW